MPGGFDDDLNSPRYSRSTEEGILGKVSNHTGKYAKKGTKFTQLNVSDFSTIERGQGKTRSGTVVPASALSYKLNSFPVDLTVVNSPSNFYNEALCALHDAGTSSRAGNGKLSYLHSRVGSD